MNTPRSSLPHPLPSNEMDALLESISQIDESEMRQPPAQPVGSGLPAEGDIGGSYEWDLNDGCLEEPPLT